MFNKKFFGGGFVFAEFAIALPLLIFLGWGLATVGMKIFYFGRIQLADYVLEEEVHDVLSRLVYDARAAKILLAEKGVPTLTFTYRTINESNALDGVIEDKTEKRVYILVGGVGKKGSKINYKRIEQYLGNPITGDNYFGETRVTKFEFKKFDDKVLHVTLEMQSEVSNHKIKMSTAVYMPGCENFKIN